VVAIAQVDGGLKAVELRKWAAEYEVVWARTSKDGQADWGRFAAECGLAAEPPGQAQAAERKKVVAGYSSAAVMFNRLDVPAAGQAEMESIVRLQAESRLPLSADQMEIAWRAGQASNGQMPVTMAVARRENLLGFVRDISDVAPRRIVLDCEGIVRVWRTFFGGDDGRAVIVNAGERSLQLCLVEHGQLQNAVVLHMGTADFAGATPLDGETETAERFVRDVRSILELFGCGKTAAVPVVFLSGGETAINVMVAALELAGLKARAALPDAGKLSGDAGLTAEELYEYRVPIGVGLIALDEREEGLDIFANVYSPAEKEEPKHWLCCPRVGGLLAAATLVLLILVSYIVDVAKPRAIDKQIRASISTADLEQLRDRQNLRRAIARQRPDMLELIKLVNDCGQGGIKLDGLHFKKGQPVSVTGQASGNDQLYKFEETLNSSKYISDAKIQNPSVDPRTKKVRFTVTFKYRNFSQKKTR